MHSLHNKSVDNLFNTILNLSSLDECYDFFEDLCTVKEIFDMASRFDAAIMLDNGKSYQQIVNAVGISTATISRVNRALSYGSGGYKNAISKLNDKESKNDNK